MEMFMEGMLQLLAVAFLVGVCFRFSAAMEVRNLDQVFSRLYGLFFCFVAMVIFISVAIPGLFRVGLITSGITNQSIDQICSSAGVVAPFGLIFCNFGWMTVLNSTMLIGAMSIVSLQGLGYIRGEEEA